MAYLLGIHTFMPLASMLSPILINKKYLRSMKQLVLYWSKINFHSVLILHIKKLAKLLSVKIYGTGKYIQDGFSMVCFRGTVKKFTELLIRYDSVQTGPHFSFISIWCSLTYSIWSNCFANIIILRFYL